MTYSSSFSTAASHSSLSFVPEQLREEDILKPKLWDMTGILVLASLFYFDILPLSSFKMPRLPRDANHIDFALAAASKCLQTVSWWKDVLRDASQFAFPPTSFITKCVECAYINIYSMCCPLHLFEGSLEVKLPTIWTDEKQSREEAERRGRLEERRVEEKE